MTKYETLYIISTAKVTAEAISEKIAKFAALIEENQGSVTKIDTDSWGMRKLAYPIEYETEGYYVLMYFEGSSELPKELERNFKNDEDILRFVVRRTAE